MPKSKLAKIGVWENGKFVGVVIYGVGATSDLVKRYGLKPEQGCELVRVALRDHETQVSRILAISFRILKKEFANLRLVVSFADPEQDHHGGIYQAGGWTYAGKSLPDRMYFINGEMVHPRAASIIVKSGKMTRRQIELYRVPNAGKHRYLMPLDDEIRQRIEPLRKPYPKRVRSEDSGTAGNQSAGGGANPTRTLQEQ